MELERQQIETEYQEQARRDQLRRATQERQEQMRRWRSTGQVQRIQSAKTRAQKSRQCCTNCLQVACTGDCPLKSTKAKVCLLCRQPYCTGSCAKTAYDDHTRQEGVIDEEPAVTTTSRIRPCSSCHSQKRVTGAPPTPARRERLKGRSALLPGKTRNSNRKDSLTLEQETGAAAARLVEGARKCRPRSAF